jgi:hypothetical protein
MYFAIESEKLPMQVYIRQIFSASSPAADVALQRFWFLLYTNLLEFREPIYG